MATTMKHDGTTRRVRAYNVRVGDVLSFYDAKKHAEKRMAVSAVDLREQPRQPDPRIVVLTLTVLGARRRQRYIQWLRWHSLIRIRRPKA